MASNSTPSQERNTPFSIDDFAKALEQHDYEFRKGQVIRGKVFQHSSDGAYVDIGGKSPGFIPWREASSQEFTALTEVLPLQQENTFLIISEQDAEGQILLSRRQLELKEKWEELEEIAKADKSVQMRVTGSNKGGVIGEVLGLRGFIPRSHLIEKQDLESLIGQLLTANFIELDRERNKIVLSQRQVARAEAVKNIVTGALLEGKVVSIKPYGVFVDLQGVTGLLHIKQVSGTMIDSLTTVFQIGQSIKVMVIEVDEIKNRISLSTKVLESYPGEILEKQSEVMANAEERAEQFRAKMTES